MRKCRLTPHQNTKTGENCPEDELIWVSIFVMYFEGAHITPWYTSAAMSKASDQVNRSEKTPPVAFSFLMRR